MINHGIYKKISHCETTTVFAAILAYLLDYIPTMNPCVQHMVIDEESLVKVYLFFYPNPQPSVQILGHVLVLEKELNALADKSKLTQNEREYLLELPNVEDNRPNHYITVLKELPDAN